MELLAWHHYSVLERGFTSHYIQEFFWTLHFRGGSQIAQET